MPEVILPGTYIKVFDEGLITAGRVATGNIGIVGTAARGPIKEVQLLSSMAEARALFGSAGDWNNSAADNLTLVRSLEHIFNNGGTKAYCVRVATADAAAATYQLQYTGMGSTDKIKLAANTKGSWGNQMQLSIGASVVNALITEEIEIASGGGGVNQNLNRANVDLGGVLSIKVLQSATGNTITYDIISGSVNNSLQQVNVNDTTGVLTFSSDFAPADGDIILATYEVLAANSKKVEVKYGAAFETYIIADILHLQSQIEQSSLLLEWQITGTAPAYGVFPEDTMGSELFGRGQVSTDVLHDPGNDGAAATDDDYGDGLQLLENEIINIVLLAGQDASNSGMRAKLEAHLNTTESIQRERMGLIGSSRGMPTTVNTISNEATLFSNDRLLFVGPGIFVSNDEILSGAYMAAAVAGLMASFPVQTSLTNKTLAIPALEREFNRAKLEKLVQERVLVVEKREGFRVVKGITTATNSALHQATVRRTVDYALYGTRSACNPYIGKLNNERVRSAMKATLDAFLTRMVDNEALISYELEVSATREQEIAGEAIVTMVLRPTFSIDFVKVSMYLD